MNNYLLELSIVIRVYHMITSTGIISVGIEKEEVKEDLTDVSLGIDLGLKILAICSDGTVFKNINKK